MFAFGLSWGYGAWLYIPEIMPLRVRGKAVGLCAFTFGLRSLARNESVFLICNCFAGTFVNWGPANLSSAFLTPYFLQPTVLGAGGTLLFFGCVAALFVPFALCCLPETKGQALEEVLPMFSFESSMAGFRAFVRGNLTHGRGMVDPAQSHSHQVWRAKEEEMQEQKPSTAVGAKF